MREKREGRREGNNHKEPETEMWTWLPSSPNHRVPVHLLTLALPGQFPVLLVTIKPTSLT